MTDEMVTSEFLHASSEGADTYCLSVIYLNESTGYGYQSCSWSSEQGNCFPLCSRSRLGFWSHETGSTVVPSHISPLILHTQTESSIINLVLTHGLLSPGFREGVHLYRQPPLGQSPESSVNNVIPYRWRFPPRVHRQGAKLPQGSLSDGRCLFRKPHGPINMHLSLTTLHCWYSGHV